VTQAQSRRSRCLAERVVEDAALRMRMIA
jgi:hypothetical protein